MTDRTLRVSGIARKFGALKAVDGLSFSISQGEAVGLIGPNGAGKTTAINLVSGVLRSDAGSIVLNGTDVTGLRTHDLALRGLRRTFQATNVFRQQTVTENLYRAGSGALSSRLAATLFATRSYREERERILQQVKSVASEFGLTQFAERAAGELPYGWQKIVGVCMALVPTPRFVLLDEPAAGLSGSEASLMGDAIAAIRDRGVGLLIVDHNMRFIESICEKLVVMHHGTLLASGETRTVFNDPLVTEAYLGTPHATA